MKMCYRKWLDFSSEIEGSSNSTLRLCIPNDVSALCNEERRSPIRLFPICCGFTSRTSTCCSITYTWASVWICIGLLSDSAPLGSVCVFVSADPSPCTGIRAKEPPHSVRRLDARIYCCSEEDRCAFTLSFLKGAGRARSSPTSASACSK